MVNFCQAAHPFYMMWIRIRIRMPNTGTDPDPQSCWKRIQLGSGTTTLLVMLASVIAAGPAHQAPAGVHRWENTVYADIAESSIVGTPLFWADNLTLGTYTIYVRNFIRKTRIITEIKLLKFSHCHHFDTFIVRVIVISNFLVKMWVLWLRNACYLLLLFHWLVTFICQGPSMRTSSWPVVLPPPMTGKLP